MVGGGAEGTGGLMVFPALKMVAHMHDYYEY